MPRHPADPWWKLKNERARLALRARPGFTPWMHRNYLRTRRWIGMPV